MGSLEAGSRVGSLEIERQVGRGGFATVYLARDGRLERLVALKVLSGAHHPSPPELEGFLAEARIIARIQSPNVVTLFRLHELDAGGDGAEPSLALEMEFVSGGTLRNVAEASPLSHDTVEHYLRGILAGLGAAHDNGVLHRDLKPANILVSSGGEAKITDFGLARMVGDGLEIDDGAFGTPLYMAPELLAGQAASVQSDLWSFGVVAYELLAGRLPFPAGDPSRFFASVLNEDPEPLPPGVPAPFRALVARCLDRDPGRRPVSWREALAILDRAPDQVRLPPAGSGSAPQLFGRENELARLEDALRPGDATSILVTGPAGIGKSALCAEVERRARDRGVLWIGARLSPAEGPLATILAAVRSAMVGDAEPSTREFGPAGTRLKRVLHGEELPALDSPQQALSTARHLLSALAPSRELVLCVDDGQHASEEDVVFLSGLARWLSDRPFRLVVASRLGNTALAGFGEARRIELAGLPSEPLFALLESRFESRIPAHVVARVFERTQGNPLQAIALVRHLKESGALVRSAETLEPRGDWDNASLPAAMRDIVHARVAALDDASRALLDVAAVDGREFDGRAAAALLHEPVIEVLRRLQQLVREGSLIAPTSRGYRFAEPVVQEVLYADMGPELRTELHRALAEHLEGRGDAVEPARLARHWEQSGERDRAAPYLVEVARLARSRQEIRRFVDLAERAGFLEEPPRVDLLRHLDLALGLAAALRRRGRDEEGEALYGRLLAVVRDDETERFRVAVRRAGDLLTSGRRPQEEVQYWQEAASRLGPTMDGARARVVVGRLAKLAGDLATARSAFEEADRIFVDCGSDWNHSMALDQLGSVATREDRLDDAQALYAEAADVAERDGLTTNATVSRINATHAGMLAGRIDGVDREFVHAIRTFELAGAFGTAAHSRIYLAEALFANGNVPAALDAVVRALPDLERFGHRAALASAWQLRAELECVAGELESALRSIVRARDEAEQAGNPRLALLTFAIEAIVAVAQGNVPEAIRAVEALRTADWDADGAGLLLCEGALSGLPAEVLSAAQPRITKEPERLLVEATLRHAAGDSCVATLERLAVDRIGLRRASYRLLTAWLAAENVRLLGPSERAKERAAAALETATALGHTRAQSRIRSLLSDPEAGPPRRP